MKSEEDIELKMGVVSYHSMQRLPANKQYYQGWIDALNWVMGRV